MPDDCDLVNRIIESHASAFEDLRESGGCSAFIRHNVMYWRNKLANSLARHTQNRGATFVVHYKSKDTNYSAQLDDQGHAEARFSIGHPTPNFVVNVDVNVNGQESCTTSFTPK